MSYWAYIFESRSVERYILADGYAVDGMAAANLIDALSSEALDAVLETLGLVPDRIVLRRGVGSFWVALAGAGAGDAIRRLRDLWSIAVTEYCPGLGFVHAIAEGETAAMAIAAGLQLLAEPAGRVATILPETPPIARRATPLSRAAVSADRLSDGCRESLDAPGLRKRQGTDAAGVPFRRSSRLTDCLLDEALRDTWRWPRDFDGSDAEPDPGSPFPFRSGSSWLAIIRVERNAPMETRPCARSAPDQGFSESLVMAARQAVARVLIPEARARNRGRVPVPARPYLCGDGCLGIIVRADLALSFTAMLLECLERDTDGGSGLETACAGVAFVRAGQCLAMAGELAESLRSQAFAESVARRPGSAPLPPSSLAFERLGSQTEVYPSNIAGFPAFGLGYQGESLPPWTAVNAFTELFSGEDMAFAPARQLIALLARQRSEARRQYRHWRETMSRALPHRLRRFDELLAAFGSPLRDLPAVERGGSVLTPLDQVFALCAVGHRIFSEPVESTHARA